MRTQMFHMDETIDQAALEQISLLLKNGELVAFPTETVYGLGADATNNEAVKKIFEAKGRPSDNPLIVHVASKAQMLPLVCELPTYVHTLIEHFSPGPITYVLKSTGKVAPLVSAGLPTIGVRIPNHPVALALLEIANLPLAAPSANRSGKPSPTKPAHVLEDLNGKIAAIIDGGATTIGLESTVVDCTGEIPIILRPGSITEAQIKQVVGACETYKKSDAEIQPKSPGLKYVHYAPEVPLLLVSKHLLKQVIAEQRKQNKRLALIYESDMFRNVEAEQKIALGETEEQIAQQLYATLRKVKKAAVDVVICELPQSLAPSSAIIDRLKRAASEIIV